MILITGGTGFIGSHLVEAVCARGEPLRCLIRRESFKRHSFALPVEAELVFGDLVSGGEGLTDTLEGVDTVIHLAGVTKALFDERVLRWQRASNRESRAGSRRARGFGLCTSALSRRSVLAPMASRSPMTPNRIPSRTTEYPNWKGSGLCGRWFLTR